ncbi:MAG: hypothetical protein ABIJ50_00885 [Pseudomonadota bacterium]
MKILLFFLAVVIMLQNKTAHSETYPVLYVAPNGEATWPCGLLSHPCKNIETAVAHANDYATTTIKVAQGEYLEHIYITSSLPASPTEKLVIEGGWDSTFTTQDRDPLLTRLSPSANNAVVTISPSSGNHANLRLVNLSFYGLTDLQRAGIESIVIGSTVNLEIEQGVIESFRGNGITLTTYDNGSITFILHDTIVQGNFQFPQNNPWPGAGVYVYVDNSGTAAVTMTNNRIVDNQTTSDGGGLYFACNNGELHATLKNNLLAGNQGGYGGAIYAGSSGSGTMTLDLVNSTISNNSALIGQGITLASNTTSTSQVYLKNSIVWQDGTDIRLRQIGASSLSLMADYSIVGEVDITEGGTYDNKPTNIHSDPLLDSSYHISSASPARDNALCGLFIFGHYARRAPYDDIDGDLRPQGDITLGCDIGADEYKFPWILFNAVLAQ